MIFRFSDLTFVLSPLYFIVTSFMLCLDRTGLIGFSILAALIHECGHFVALRFVYRAPLTVKFCLYGFQMESKKVLLPFSAFIVSAAGPFINLIFSIGSYALYWFSSNRLWLAFSAIHLLIGGLNLLPFSGLDGGEILQSLLKTVFPENKANRIFRIVTIICLILTAPIGLYLIYNTGNLTLICLIVYLFCLNLFKI